MSLKLGEVLKSIEPYQVVVIEAAESTKEFDFLGTAIYALAGGLEESLKKITKKPFEMNVSKMEAQTGYFLFEETELDKPVIHMTVD